MSTTANRTESIIVKPQDLKLAVTIMNAIDRAKASKQITFIRIYHDGDNIHVGELYGDAALEIQEFINDRKHNK